MQGGLAILSRPAPLTLVGARKLYFKRFLIPFFPPGILMPGFKLASILRFLILFFIFSFMVLFVSEEQKYPLVATGTTQSPLWT